MDEKKFLDIYVPCRDTMPSFTIFGLILDLQGFKNRDSSHKMFSNSTWFTHKSRVPTKPWPMPPLLRARSESCVLIGQNPNPTDRTSAPLDAPRSNGNPEPFR